MISTFWKNVLLYGPALLLWSLLLLVAARQGATPVLYAPAIQAIPSGPLLLVTLSLRPPRGATLQALLGGDLPLFQEELRTVCGADPLAGAAEIALAMPAAAGDGEFGIVVVGMLQAHTLIACASQVIQARGGRPIVLQDGGFFLISDVASPSEGVLAVRDGGPILLGGASYVRRMMDTVHRREPSVELDARHVALRGEVGPGALVATLLLSADLRERFREEVGGSSIYMEQVLGVALCVSADDPAHVRAAVGCASEKSCAEVSGVLQQLQRQEKFSSSIPGLESTLEGARIKQTGPVVQVQANFSSTVLSLLAKVGREALRKP